MFDIWIFDAKKWRFSCADGPYGDLQDAQARGREITMQTKQASREIAQGDVIALADFVNDVLADIKKGDAQE